MDGSTSVNRDVKQFSAVTEVEVIFTQVRGFINVMDGGFRNYSSGIWCLGVMSGLLTLDTGGVAASARCRGRAVGREDTEG